MRIQYTFRFALLMLLFLAAGTPLLAQTAAVQQINKTITTGTALAPLYFLSADELMGRSPQRPEIHIAARYISEGFRSAGLKPVPGTTDYFQTFGFNYQSPATRGSITAGNKTFQLGTEFLQTAGRDTTFTAPAIYVTRESVATADVKGKIVVTDGQLSNQLLQERGALAKVVRFKKGNTPWEEYQHAFARERPATTNLLSFVVNDEGAALPTGATAPATSITISTEGAQLRSVPMKNVMGWVEGTDPKLKDQYIVLSAHYDHVGVAPQAKMADGKMDSIYNGARDNAIGVAAVMSAAQYFALYPPKRSVLLLAYTAEEGGMLGSKYFAQNPALPLRKLVYNLNIDNAGYNDTTIVTVVGLGRTSADEHIKKGAAGFGLTAIADPAPEQGLFDRSDNVNLALKGVPAPTFSLGFRKFDEEISHYYHQVTDEAGTMSPAYATKYIKAFILSAKYIADDKEQPVWLKGDKYEAAWKALYQ